MSVTREIPHGTVSGYCQGCGAPLAPKHAPGPPRKWCSERCRKQTLYSTPCVDCGRPVSGSDGKGAHPRCRSCNGRRGLAISVAKRRERHAPRRALIERMWAEGATGRQIGEALGILFSPGAYRRHGYDLPYRRTPEQVERIRAGRYGALP